MNENEEFEFRQRYEQEAGGAAPKEGYGFMPSEVGMGPRQPTPTKLPGMIDLHPGVGAAETLIGMGTGALGSAIGGLAGAGRAMLPGPEGAGAALSADVQNALSYQPRTTAGQKMSHAAGVPFELLAKGADVAGAKTAEASGSPALGAGVNALIQGAPAILPYGFGKAKGAINEARAGRAGEAIFDESQPAPVMPGEPGPGLMERMARGLMQSAMKPDLRARRTGKAEQAVGTALEEGMSPTRGGMEDLSKHIESLDDALSKAIADSPAQAHAYGSPLQEVYKLVQDLKKQVTPQADVRAAWKAIDDFVNNSMVKEYIPVQVAQQLKQGTYKALGSKAYGEVGTADLEAQKALARGLKNEVAEAVPEVGPINARLSNLLNLREVMAPRIALEANKNPVGLGVLSPSLGAFGTWLLERSPWAKGLAARGLYQGRVTGPQVAAGMERATPLGVGQESAEEAAKNPSQGPSIPERALNAIVSPAGAADYNQKPSPLNKDTWTGGDFENWSDEELMREAKEYRRAQYGGSQDVDFNTRMSWRAKQIEEELAKRQTIYESDRLQRRALQQ